MESHGCQENGLSSQFIRCRHRQGEAPVHRVKHLLISFRGTLDAMLHGSLWDPEADVKENAGAYVDEVCTGKDLLNPANGT